LTSLDDSTVLDPTQEVLVDLTKSLATGRLGAKRDSTKSWFGFRNKVRIFSRFAFEAKARVAEATFVSPFFFPLSPPVNPNLQYL
jgi:hypothetical protein